MVRKKKLCIYEEKKRPRLELATQQIVILTLTISALLKASSDQQNE